MAQARIYEGTWEEISAHAAELRSYPKLTLIAREEAGAQSATRYRPGLSPEERIRQMDAFAESNRGLPTLPDEAFNRESLYGDDDR
jgi:hypothetical protein